jgi:hypothetical protein
MTEMPATLCLDALHVTLVYRRPLDHPRATPHSPIFADWKA